MPHRLAQTLRQALQFAGSAGTVLDRIGILFTDLGNDFHPPGDLAAGGILLAQCVTDLIDRTDHLLGVILQRRDRFTGLGNVCRFGMTSCTPVSMRLTPLWMPLRTTSTVLAISTVDCAVRSANLRTSSATTAKPRPCSPARAASMAAFSASRLV